MIRQQKNIFLFLIITLVSISSLIFLSACKSTKTDLTTYQVFFQTNGGSKVETQIVQKNSLIKKVDSTKDGYTLEGWYREDSFANKWNFDEHLVNNNITLFAKWILNKHTVSFNSNGGSEVNSLEVEDNSLISKPTDPTKDGYSFEGWYKNSDLTVTWNFAEDKVKEDTILYAKWTKIVVPVVKYTVSFNSNGGTNVHSLEVEDNCLISKPTDPTKDGYTFEGWYKNSDLTVAWNFEEDKVKEDTTLFAKWESTSITPIKIEMINIKGNSDLSTFYIGKHQITQSQFESVMGFNPSYFQGKDVINNPVEQVTWFDAVMFCNELSKKENLKPYYNISNVKKNNTSDNIISATVSILGGNGYRLPTEAEWEYAARGGNKSKGYTYAGSNNVNEVAWYWNNSINSNASNGLDWNKRGTHPVGRLKANELGLYDMSGNVWEWCWDNALVDRVLLGGSWTTNNIDRLKISKTNSDRPNLVVREIGFRIARNE